jgi:hypothetical protein
MSATAKPEARLEQAQANAEQAKRRFASTKGALQYRLKPGTIVNHAWEGAREKGTVVADDALQAVKDRPGAAAGVIAAVVLFFARDPLWRTITGIFSHREEEDEGVIKADLDHHDKDYDLTAPTVERSRTEGVNA